MCVCVCVCVCVNLHLVGFESPCVYYAIVMMAVDGSQEALCGCSGQPALRPMSTRRHGINACH